MEKSNLTKENIKTIAMDTLDDFDISSFPISITKLIKDMANVKIQTYPTVKSNPDLRNALMTISVDALSSFKNGYFYVFYNNDVSSKSTQRIRFSLAHELGHILLGHFYNHQSPISTLGRLSNSEYKKLEIEADTFASELLAPTELIDTSLSTNEISKQFDISQVAASIALKRAIKSFNKYVSECSFRPALGKRDDLTNHYLICSTCKSETSNPLFQIRFTNSSGESQQDIIPSSFCNICGGNEFKKINSNDYFEYREELISGDIKVMNYSSIDVTEGIANKCPACGYMNKHRYDFCPICGKYLKNRCTSIEPCDIPQIVNPTDFAISYTYDINGMQQGEYLPCSDGQALTGDCRFCPYCGSITTFGSENFLSDYQQEKEQKETIKEMPF